MVVPVRRFSYTPHSDHREKFLISSLLACWIGENFLFLSYSPRAGFRQDVRFSYTIIVRTTQMRSQRLCLDQTKMQEQGLTGYSSVRLTSRASHRLGKCQLSWVWLGFGLLSALSECMLSARQPPTRLVWLRLRYRLTRQLSPDMTSSVHLSFFLHSSCCLVRSFSYTPRAGFSQEFLLHSSSWFSESHEFLLHSLSLFKWGVSLTLLELVLVRSFSYTPRAGFSKRFPLHF